MCKVGTANFSSGKKQSRGINRTKENKKTNEKLQ